MLDSKGIDRGRCKECIGECDEYDKPKTDASNCNYCGCPATKHEKSEIVLVDPNKFMEKFNIVFFYRWLRSVPC